MALITSHWGLDAIVLLLSAIAGAYLYMTRKFNYWKKRGVMELQPRPFFGNFADCVTFKRSPGEHLKDLYDKSPGLKYMGFYIFDKPAILLRDPEIIGLALVKDFNNFEERIESLSENDSLGAANLFLVQNPHWKFLRHKLTPFFTSGKIKKMFELILAVGKDLDSHLKSLGLEGKVRTAELTEICARYTTDVIATVAFGLQVNSLNNPDAQFRKYGRKMFEFTYRRAMEFSSFFFAPGLVQPFGFKFFSEGSSNFIREVFWETTNKRIESGTKRNDLIDILIGLKDSKNPNDEENTFKFEGDNLAAQAALFFVAGFETTATTMSFTLYELSLNPDIQRRLRDEINAALDKNSGELTYEMVMNLLYLDMVVSETLRKYPPVPLLNRVTTADYKLRNTDLVIEKGTPVYIPVYGIHRDPEYFPDPEKYDPERFSQDNKRKRTSYTYMPFGEGPRNCIGLRLGLLQVKLGLIHILSEHEITPCEQTLIPMVYNHKSFVTACDGGIFTNIRKIPRSAE